MWMSLSCVFCHETVCRLQQSGVRAENTLVGVGRTEVYGRMTISGISGATQVQASGGVDPSSWLSQMQQTLGPVAQLFGESTQQLMNDLQSGKTSLSQLAQSKGISQTDLLNAIQQGLQRSSTDNGQQLSSTQLTNLATMIANRVHGGHHHHSGGGASSGSSSANPLSAVDQDVEQLLQDLGTALSANGTTSTSATTDAATTSTTPSGSSTNALSALQSDAAQFLHDLSTAFSINSSTSATSTTGTSSSSSTNPLSDVQQDLGRLLQDLGTAISAYGSNGPSTTDNSLTAVLNQSASVNQLV